MYMEERVSTKEESSSWGPQCQGAKPYEAPWTPVEEIRNKIVTNK